jgi:hypothetical protein
MRAVTLASCAVLLAACAKRVDSGAESAPVGTPAEFYPLAVGNRWVYEANFLGQQRESTVEIQGQTQGFFRDSMGGQLTVDAFGVRDDKRYLLREPLAPGRTWTNVVSVSSVEHYTILDAGLNCEAPAGKFESCVRVEVKNRVDDKTTLVNQMTFAKGVGLVRVEVWAQTQGKRIPQTQLLLKEYALKTGAP